MQEPSEDKSKDIHDFSEKVSQIAHTFENSRFWTKKLTKVMQEPSEDKSKQNRRDIHEFSEKVSQIVHTFENLRF